MKRIITNDKNLINLIQNIDTTDKVTVYNNKDGFVNVVEDSIIIDSETIKNIEEINDVLHFDKLNIIYVVDKKINNMDNRIVQVVKVKDQKKMKERITTALIGEQSALGNVIGFVGATRNVGTTMIALSISRHIQQYSELNVAVLSFTLTKGLEFAPEMLPTFNSVMRRVENKVFNAKKAMETLALDKKENDAKGNVIAYMHGMDGYIEYTEFEIIETIKVCAEAFDLVVLDLGSIPSKMMVTAIGQSQHLFMVSTANVKAIDEYEDSLIKMHIDEADAKVILNKTEEFEEYSEKEFETQVGLKVIGSIPFNRLAYTAELERKTLNEFSTNEVGGNYKRAVYEVITAIADKIHIPLETPATAKRRFGIGG